MARTYIKPLRCSTVVSSIGFTRPLAVWNEHDTTDLPELVTDDLVWIDPGWARRGSLSGVYRHRVT